jgi:hypothetical protein
MDISNPTISFSPLLLSFIYLYALGTFFYKEATGLSKPTGRSNPLPGRRWRSAFTVRLCAGSTLTCMCKRRN